MTFPVIFLLAAVTALTALGVTLLFREPQGESLMRHGGSPAQSSPLEILTLGSVLMPCLANLTLRVYQGTIVTFLPFLAQERSLGNAGFYFTAMSAL